VDSPAAFTPVTTATLSTGRFGTYQFASNGQWTYTLNNDNPTVNALNSGQTLTDTFIVSASDGTTQTVTVTINGNTDATSGSDTLIGTDGDDVINGLEGGDIMTGGAGADTFVVSSTISLSGTGNAGIVSGFDVITDFVSKTDRIELPVNFVRADDRAQGLGVTPPSAMTVSNAAITGHSIANGTVSFFRTTGKNLQALSINSEADVAAAVQYLSFNDIGNAGATVTFRNDTAMASGNFKNYIYQQPLTTAGGTSATLVEIQVAGTYTLPATTGTQFINPIALDLNRDGVTYIDRSQGVTYDYENDGSGTCQPVLSQFCKN